MNNVRAQQTHTYLCFKSRSNRMNGSKIHTCFKIVSNFRCILSPPFTNRYWPWSLTPRISTNPNIQRMQRNAPRQSLRDAVVNRLVHIPIQLALRSFDIMRPNTFRHVTVAFQHAGRIFICVLALHNLSRL